MMVKWKNTATAWRDTVLSSVGKTARSTRRPRITPTCTAGRNVHEFVDSTHHPYAREKGYIFYRTSPKTNVDSILAALVREERGKLVNQ